MSVLDNKNSLFFLSGHRCFDALLCDIFGWAPWVYNFGVILPDSAIGVGGKIMIFLSARANISKEKE